MNALERYNANALKLIEAPSKSPERCEAFQRLANYCAKSFNSNSELINNGISRSIVDDEMFMSYYQEHKQVLKDYGTTDREHYKQEGIKLIQCKELPDYEDLECGITLIDFPPAQGKTTRGLQINKAFSRVWIDSINFRLDQIAARSSIPMVQHVVGNKYATEEELAAARHLTINMFSLHKWPERSTPDFLLLDEFQYGLQTFINWGRVRNNNDIDTLNCWRTLKFLIHKTPNIVRMGSHITKEELAFWKERGRPITIYHSGYLPFENKVLYRSKNNIEDLHHLERVVTNKKLPLVVHTERGQSGIIPVIAKIQQQYPDLKIVGLHKDNINDPSIKEWTSKLDDPEYKLPFDVLVTTPIFAIGTHCINKFKSQWGLFETSLKKVGLQGMYQAFQRERQSMEYQWIRLSKGGKNFQVGEDFKLDFFGEETTSE